MSLDKNKKVIRPNNSKSDNKRSKVLQLLHKIFIAKSGTVSYVFLSERVRFTKENPNGETYANKSVIHSNINPAIFTKVENGRTYKRSLEEVAKVLEDTCHDLGANYYLID